MQWLKVFASEVEAVTRLNSGPQLVIAAGHRICLVRHQDAYFAVQDSCTHNGESLARGRVNHLGEIVCPWHGYRFNLLSGQACDSSCSDLHIYPVRSDETGVYIGLP